MTTDLLSCSLNYRHSPPHSQLRKEKDLNSKADLVLLGVRHGATDYTDTGLDLTELGRAQVKELAQKQVLKWMARHGVTDDTLMLVSSHAPRARGTTALIKLHADLPTSVVVDPLLGPMQWRDPKRCAVALKGLKGRGYIDYETEPVFADPTMFETPVEMHKRWYAYLTKLIVEAREGNVLPHRILVSHYEVLCHITRDLFSVIATESAALKNAEHIELSISVGAGDLAYVRGVFRDIYVERTFNLVSQRFKK